MTDLQRIKKVINWLIFMEFAENEREMLKTSQSETGVISVPINVWEVIKSQADSLKSKDRQIDELISMLKERGLSCWFR